MQTLVHQRCSWTVEDEPPPKPTRVSFGTIAITVTHTLSENVDIAITAFTYEVSLALKHMMSCLSCFSEEALEHAKNEAKVESRDVGHEFEY